MKKHIITLIILAATSLFAAEPLYKSSPDPAVRLADAKAQLTGSNPSLIYGAVVYVLQKGTSEDQASLTSSLLSDPTLGGKTNNPAPLFSFALQNKYRRDGSGLIAATPALLAAVAQPTRDAITPSVAALVNRARVDLATQYISDKKFAEASALLLSNTTVFTGNYLTASRAVAIMATASVALSSTDALGWAKVDFYLQPYAATGDGVDSMTRALRLSGDLVSSNAFIQFTKDGVGPNILDSIPTPAVCLAMSTDTPTTQCVSAILHGTKVEALRIAVAEFSQATDTASLNRAVSLLAQTLRNYDGNTVRSNDCVTAQKNGTPFTIGELQ